MTKNKEIDDARNKYKSFNLISFPFLLKSTWNENKQKFVKKNSILPADWPNLQLNSKFINKPSNYNAIAILTGKSSGIFVIDIDILDDWQNWLLHIGKTNDWLSIQDTIITANSANGGKHLYFQYNNSLDIIKGRSNCFGTEWAIDTRTTGNCIYAFPSKLINDDVKWKYTWDEGKSFDDLKLQPVPDWLVEQLNNKNKPQKIIHENINETEDIKEIRNLLQLFSKGRCENYNDWLAVGMNLYSISSNMLEIWDNWSKSCKDRYESNVCSNKWNTFKATDSHIARATLKKWAREDNPLLYNEKYGIIEVSVEHRDIIKEFITEKFHYPPTRLSNIIVKKYDTKDYIFVNINEKWCPLSKTIHDDPNNFVQFSFNNAIIKCRHQDCINNIGKSILWHDFPIKLKEIIESTFTPTHNDMEIVENYFKESPRDNIEKEEINNMNTKLSERKETIWGHKYDMTDNLYCPIHKKFHDRAENCLFISEQKKKMAVLCNLAPFENPFPQSGIDVPHQIIQIITKNTINNNNIQNNYYNNYSDEDTYDYLFDEIFDIFEDKELNRLINISFKGYACDIAEVFCYLGGDLFGMTFEEKDNWWCWSDREKRWISTSHKAHIFCNKIVADKYVITNKWLRDNTPDDDLRIKRLSKIDGIIKRLKDKDQNSILTQVAILLKENKPEFENDLDSNKDIMNFKGDMFMKGK